MYLDANLKFDTTTVNGTSPVYTADVDLGADNVGDGVAPFDFYAIANTVPAAGDPDTTAYTISLQFSNATGGSFSPQSTVPMVASTLRSLLIEGRYVTNPRPLLRIPNRYCRVAIYPTGTSATGAKFDFGFTVNAYKPDSGV